MILHTRATVAASVFVCVAGFASVFGQEGYVADPDPVKHPTLHVQPPVLPAIQSTQTPRVPASVINGITYIDVMTAAGYDLAGYDVGNEPAITANPQTPSQIVLTSFSGSNWGVGGNSSFWYSSNAGASWSFLATIPPPPGQTTNVNCPCDQTLDWGRDGLLYGTFLFEYTNGSPASVFSAQAQDPANAASWTYRAPGGVAQTTSGPIYPQPDQPWLWSGPLPGDNGQTHVAVGYDVFDAGYSNSETHAADSPGASPLDFSRDVATNDDGVKYNDGMNPGTRIAIGPDGKIWNVFQRLGLEQSNGIKQLTYIVTVSTDAGLSFSAANSDHASLGKVVFANALSFQGNGSKVGGVNALLGGVDAIAADPGSGNAWIVYGRRTSLTAHDQLFLVKVTYSAGSLLIGTPVTVSQPTIDAYLPAVAVLPNGEVGVLYLTYNGASFQWVFTQYTNGTTFAKSTGFPAFTSPFMDNGNSNQRIFGDYVQVRAVGCNFDGTYPARGAGASSVNSIVPYFMSAPSFNACAPPTLTSLTPSAACAGGPGLNVTLQGTGFANGANGLVDGALRTTTFVSSNQVTTAVQAGDLTTVGSRAVRLLGASPAGGLSGTLALTVEAAPASPGASLRADGAAANVSLSWSSTANATSYRVRRCTATAGPCAPAAFATSPGASYQDAARLDADSYWYQIDAVNSCGPVP